MKAKILPSLDYLDECFELSADSPSGLVWRVRPQKHFKNYLAYRIFTGQRSGKSAGSVMTTIHGHSYYETSLNATHYMLHRILFSMHFRVTLSDTDEIDHEDGNGLNNDLDNLRLASHCQNQQNKRMAKNNTSGVKGVSWNKLLSKWRVDLGLNKTKTYAYFDSFESAVSYVKDARTAAHKNFHNHGE